MPAYHFGTQCASSTAKTTKCCWYISDCNTSLHLKLVIMDSGLTKMRWYLPSVSILSSFSPHTKVTERPRDAKEATYTTIIIHQSKYRSKTHTGHLEPELGCVYARPTWLSCLKATLVVVGTVFHIQIVCRASVAITGNTSELNTLQMTMFLPTTQTEV